MLFQLKMNNEIRIIYMRNTKVTVKHSDLMAIGFPEKTAREIIKQAKAIAVQRFENNTLKTGKMIQLSQSPFNNVRLNLAPASIVEELLGFELPLLEKEGA